MIKLEEVIHQEAYRIYMEKIKKQEGYKTIEEHLQLVCNKIEILLHHHNKELIEYLKIATHLTYLSLFAKTKDYIQSSSVLVIELLNHCKVTDKERGIILMAMAGQGNEFQNMNIMSAPIVLANMYDLPFFLNINAFPASLIDAIKDYEANYEAKTDYFELNVYISKKQQEQNQDSLDRLTAGIQRASDLLGISCRFRVKN